MLSIRVSCDEQELFRCGWVEGFDYPFDAFADACGVSTCLLGFFEVDAGVDVPLKKGSVLGLGYRCGEWSVGEFEITLTHPLLVPRGRSGTLFSHFQVYQELDQLQLRLLKSWSGGVFDLRWQHLNSPRKRRSWLRACSVWDNSALQPEHLIANRQVPLDLSAVDCQETFYCYLGEAVLGPRGYLGQDLQGFYECLASLVQARHHFIGFELSGLHNQRAFSSRIGSPRFLEKWCAIVDELGCTLSY